MAVPDNSVGKESACHAGDLGLIAGLGRSPGEGKGYQPQYSVFQNSYFSSPSARYTSELFSDSYCKSLVSPLEVKLKEVGDLL